MTEELFMEKLLFFGFPFAFTFFRTLRIFPHRKETRENLRIFFSCKDQGRRAVLGGAVIALRSRIGVVCTMYKYFLWETANGEGGLGRKATQHKNNGNVAMKIKNWNKFREKFSTFFCLWEFEVCLLLTWLEDRCYGRKTQFQVHMVTVHDWNVLTASGRWLVIMLFIGYFSVSIFGPHALEGERRSSNDCKWLERES